MKRIDKLSKNILKYPSRKKAMVESDYTEQYSSSGHILKTKQYQEKMKPIKEQLEEERQRIIQQMKSKNLSKEKYKDLVESMDKITKNVQLLSGGATERIVSVSISQEIADKNKVYDSHSSTENNSN